MEAKLDMNLLMSLWSEEAEIMPKAEPEPIKEKSASFSFYRQAPEHEEQESDNISEPVARLKKFYEEYYVDINEINFDTGKPQTFEEYLSGLIREARDDLRRENYFDKESQLEFIEELESYLMTWHELKNKN